jgi:hypothetical protein
MRSRLDNNPINAARFTTASTDEAVILAISGTFTIPDTNPAPLYVLNAASTGQNVVLPAAPGGSRSLRIRIRNASTGAVSLTVQDPTGPATVVALTQGQTGEYFSTGTAWHGGVVGSA